MLTNKPLRTIILLSAILMLIGSCKKFDELKNPLDGFKLYINYDIFDTFLSFRFIDSETGDLISSTTVNAEISGQDKDGVVDQLGKHKDNYSSVFGLMSLALNPKEPYVPTVDGSFQFRLTASADGYQDQALDISISEAGSYSYEIYLQKEASSTQGYEKNIRVIKLDGTGSPIDNFILSSGIDGFKLSISSSTIFQDQTHTAVPDSEATVGLTVFSNFNKAPIPHTLITNVEIDGAIQQMSFDPLNVIDININTVSSSVKYFDNDEIQLTFRLDSNYVNPNTGNALRVNDILKIWNYDPTKKSWLFEAESLIEKSDDGQLILRTSTNHLSIFAVGIIQPVCNFTGAIDFNFTKEFPIEPVGTRLYCYRKSDNKYISLIDYNLTQQDNDRDFNFLVPENNTVQLRIRQKSNANGFTATSANIVVEKPCGQSHNFNVDITPTSIQFTGQITFNFAEEFPNDNFNLRLYFYNADTGSYLFGKTYNVSDGRTIQIDTGVPAGQRLKLTFTASNKDNSFTSMPSEIIIDDPSVSGQNWTVNLSPVNCKLNGALNCNITGLFDNDQIDMNLEVIDEQSNIVVQTIPLQITPGTADITFSTVLSKSKAYSFRIKRTSDGQKFHAYPYIFNTFNDCSGNAIWTVDLSPVTEELIVFNVTVVCPSTEIIPTLHGFYRTVWEDDWHETDIVSGYLEAMLEMNGTYEIGLIIDDKMQIEEYLITETVNDIVYELSEEECDKMGW